MRRNAENRAGAVIHQHEVRDVDGQEPVAVERMDGLDSGAKALLLCGLDLGRAGAALAAFGDELGRLRIARRERLGDRMGWRDGDEAGAEDGVGARGEDFDLVDAVRGFGEAEAELEATALADPVLLHQPDLVGPGVERSEPFEQIFGEIGDLQKPLRQPPPFDRRARPPALAVDHLLIGEHRACRPGPN